MSCQKGNASRSRPQKYKNRHAFKNDLHDKSKRTKVINELQVAHVCERCKKVIEWKIKYKKYKLLKAAAKCNKCELKTIKHSYHTICQPCAKKALVCPKCGSSGPVVDPQPTKEEQLKFDQEFQELLKMLPERKRRTFIRYMNKKNKEQEEKNEGISDENEKSAVEELTQEQLLAKLKAFVIKEDDEDLDDDCFSDSSEESIE